MKHPRKLVYSFIAVGVTMAVAALLWLQKQGTHEQPPAHISAVSRRAPPEGSTLVRPGPVSNNSTPIATAPAPLSQEVTATRRMYAAHAPLRTSPVADPDSEANRKILDTMVRKALRRSSEQNKRNQ